MFLSRLHIATSQENSPAGSWLKNLYRVHQRLCMAFPSEERKSTDPDFLNPFSPDDFKNHVHYQRDADNGFLFRIDPGQAGNLTILIQSAIQPDWNYAFHNAPYMLGGATKCKPFGPVFSQDQDLRFRLTANPVKNLPSTERKENGKRRSGKRIPVPTVELAGWLQRQAEKSGFSIDPKSLQTELGSVFFNKDKKDKGQLLKTCRFDGILTVTDPALFKQTIVKGIGPAKAFGCGLLSVARI